MVGGRLIAASERRAAQLAGITLRQLRYWHEVSLVAPSVDRRLGPRTRVRLYYFDRLLELLVAARLRGQPGISLQHIRRVVSHLRNIGYEAPLRELAFAISGQEIYFRYPDGTWSGDPAPQQVVLHQVLELEPLVAQIDQARERSADQIARVERRRGTVGSKPVFAGTRLPVEKVKAYIDHGFTTPQILDSYPFLTEADVEATRRGELTAA
jgi:DNA-binding transcriptional MerR regulator